MGLLSKQESYLGVDIGAHGIKLVELHKNKNRPQLWTYGILNEPLDIHIKDKTTGEKKPEDLLSEESRMRMGNGNSVEEKKKIPPAEDPRVARYGELLKAVLKQSKAESRQATASLPVSEVFHTILTLPEIEDKELDHIVKAEIKKFLSRPVEEMQVMFQKIPQKEENKHSKVLVTTAPKYIIQFYTGIFEAAGIQLKELETEAFALERSLVGRDKATVLIIDIGAERTNFFVMDKGLPITHRSIQIGGDLVTKIVSENLGVEQKQAEQIKKDMSSLNDNAFETDIFDRVAEPIIKEVQYSFDVFLQQFGGETRKPEKIILSGGSSVMPIFRKVLEKEFGIKVFVGDPWARVVYQQGLKSVLDSVGPRMAVSIGLALRNLV